MHEAGRASGKVLDARLGLREILVHVAVADDRPGDELREERLVRAEGYEVSFRLHLAAPNVDCVGDALEGEERDADRQHDRLQPIAQGMDIGQPQVAAEEKGVLEVDEQRQVEADNDGEAQLVPPRRDPQAAEEVDEDAGDQDQRLEAGRPVIEGGDS